MTSLTAIQNRIDALASEALEEIVEEVEARDGVKVTDMQVQVADTPSGQPALEVNVTIERASAPSGYPREPPANDLPSTDLKK